MNSPPPGRRSHFSGSPPQSQRHEPRSLAKRRGADAKWVLSGLCLLVAVVVVAVATLLVSHDNADPPKPPTASGPPGAATKPVDVASADDRDPAGIVLEDSTCQSWSPIAAAFVSSSENGWGERDPAIPARDWTPDVRSQYEAIGVTLRSAGERSVELARATPHRIMRQLYSQFIAYSRAYVDAIADYTPDDDALVRVVISASSALSAVCDAVTYGSAGARSPLVARAAATPGLDLVVNPAISERFLLSGSPVCAEWLGRVSQFDQDITGWKAIDPNIPARQLDSDSRAMLNAARPVMTAFSTDIQQIGLRSDNSVLSDFATTGAQYLRGYVSSIQTYTPADNFLALAASAFTALITGGCRAAEN